MADDNDRPAPWSTEKNYRRLLEANIRYQGEIVYLRDQLREAVNFKRGEFVMDTRKLSDSELLENLRRILKTAADFDPLNFSNHERIVLDWLIQVGTVGLSARTVEFWTADGRVFARTPYDDEAGRRRAIVTIANSVALAVRNVAAS